MKTFKDIFNHLHKINDISEWINEISGSEAGYRQEASLKLLSGLDTIDKLKLYTHVLEIIMKKRLRK